MSTLTIRRTEPLVEATAVLVDLRNFTPNLNAAPIQHQINGFCHFLADMYGDCVEAVLTSLPAAQRGQPPVYVNGSGDGGLFVFFGKRHFAFGFLAGVLLDARLSQTCVEYNARPKRRGAPDTGFGVGIESGFVNRVFAREKGSEHGLGIDAFIGHCVNIAARVETITKTLYAANTIVADTTVELVAREIAGTTFEELRRRERRSRCDARRLAVHREMADLNQKLCLSYVNRHILKGVKEPMPLYRLARSAVKPGLPRFDELLRVLVRDDRSHLAEVRRFLTG